MAARRLQETRYATAGVRCNARLQGRHLDEYCQVGEAGRRLLQSAIQSYGFSARSCDRILRVARTIADLAGAEAIGEEMLYEAIQYRVLDKKYW